MNYTFLKDTIGSPWQIEFQTLNALLPILKGMVKGFKVDKGEEPQNHRSFRLNVRSGRRSTTSGSGAKDLNSNNGSALHGETNAKVINILPLRGILTKHDQDCGPRGTRTLGNRLLIADVDSSVIGHIMIIESGGGQVMAVPELTEAMMKCTKPIVVWVDGIAASAAYHISCYAKEIVASRDQDIIGCIGTMIVWEGRKSKSEGNKDGNIQVTIYADGSGEKNEEYEQAINEFNFKPARDRILNPLNAKFKSDVISQRPIVKQSQLTGKTYFAGEVVGTLIDSIGNFDFALQRVLAFANFKENNSSKGNQSTSMDLLKVPVVKPVIATIRTAGQIKKTSPDEVDWETINNLPHNKQLDSNL
jgi:protease-4